MYAELQKIEMFCRSQRKSWDIGEISVHKFKESLAFSRGRRLADLERRLQKALHSIGVPQAFLYPAIGQKELRSGFEAFEIAQ